MGQTMSQSRTEAGQSMEEILASIRRIIAEGERDAQDTGGQRPEPAAAAEPARSEKVEAKREDEVLVLTKMVLDDGSYIDLESSAPQPAPPDEASVESLLRKSLLAEAAPSSVNSITSAIEAVEVAFGPKVAPAPPPEAPAAAPVTPVKVEK